MITTPLLSADSALAAPSATGTGSSMKRVPPPGEHLEFRTSLKPGAYPTSRYPAPISLENEKPSNTAFQPPRESPKRASSTVSPESSIASPCCSSRVGSDSGSQDACPKTEEKPEVDYPIPATRVRGIRQPRRAEVWERPLTESQAIALRRHTTNDSRRCPNLPSFEDAKLTLLKRAGTRASEQPVTLSQEQHQDGPRPGTHPWKASEIAKEVASSSQNLVTASSCSESKTFLPPISRKHPAHMKVDTEDRFSDTLPPVESQRMRFAVNSRRYTTS